MDNSTEYKLNTFQINKLKETKLLILRQETERNEHIRKEKEKLKQIFFTTIFEKFNDAVVTSSNYFQFDLNKISLQTEKKCFTASDIFENNFRHKLVFDASLNSIKVSTTSLSILVSYEEVFKMIAKCCYHLNFAFHVVIGDCQQRFMVDKERPFKSSSWNYVSVEINNENVVLKCFSQDQILFSIH